MVRRFSLIGVAIAAIACAHDERRAVAVPSASEKTTPPALANEYLLAEAGSHAHVAMVAVGPPGVQGLVVGKRRIVLGQGEPRVATDVPEDAILGVLKLPRRFGSGFLFWTARSLFRGDTFDGPLSAVVQMPDAIDSVSLMPKALLVRTHNGERWGVGVPAGERQPVAGPLGIVDVEALEDGRAVAFSDQGAIFTSLDNGEHWTDATAQLRSSPTRVTQIEGEAWIFESNGGALRLEGDGRLSSFDKAPAEVPADVRVRDPRWHGADPPLRAVFLRGAALDDATALVIDSGDLVRVDTRSGEIVSVLAGRLPPDASCEALPTPGDILFACASTANSGSFVVAHTLTSEAPQIEQSFGEVLPFFGSADGGLVYAGPCRGQSTTAGSVVCVRTPGGRWEERDLSGLSVPAGTTAHAARWVPRVDGRVVAIVVDPKIGIYDPTSNSFQPLTDEARDLADTTTQVMSVHRGKPVRMPRSVLGKRIDGAWSFTSAGTLRGWAQAGGTFEITEDGTIVRSPYAFEAKYAGAMGLGHSGDGRFYQTTDQGVSWNEVAAPPSGADGLEVASCTSAGCDLGAFYRVGWPARAPRVEPPSRTIANPPDVRRVLGLELTCRPQGQAIGKVLARTAESPDDLGLGAARLPIAPASGRTGYVRNAVARGIVSPIREATINDVEGAASLRALFSGYGTSHDGDVIKALAPNTSALALRRVFTFIAPFDPSARPVRATLAMSDVVLAGRRIGMTTDEVLNDDFTETGAVIPLVSTDPGAPSDVAIHNVDHGLIAFVRGERARVALRPNPNNSNIVSGVMTGPDEAAFLELDASGVGHVFKVGTTVTDLFDVFPTTNDTLAAPNPDALAIGPKGELAVLRTPSGSDPASAFDRAYLIVPGVPNAPLAPWSEVRLADDPACKAEQGGYRAALQLVGPWIRFTNPELHSDSAPMIARVRWTPTRVCLEGFEVKGPPVSVRARTEGGSEGIALATWIVARGSSFARVAVAEGAEWRQPLECQSVR